MTKFIEQITQEDKAKYIKDVEKNINFETYPKVKDFILNNELYITNVKTGLIEIEDKNATLISKLKKSKEDKDGLFYVLMER